MGSAVIKCAGEFSISRATFSQPYIPPPPPPPLPNRTLSLLLHMDGANNSTTFRDDSLNYLGITANGNAQISTSEYRFGGASGYFDGDDSYLSVQGSGLFNFYATDFTMECWIYIESNQNGGSIFSTRNSAVYSPWEIQINGDNKIYLLIRDNYYGWYGNGYTGNTEIPHNEWVHIAWVCKESNHTVYINGTADTNLTNLSAPLIESVSQPANLYIGKGGDGLFCGYIDEARIVKGNAEYIENFTPPSQPFITPQISIFLHMDGSNESTNFVDSSLNNLTVTPAETAQISTAQNKFGGASGYFIRQDDSYLQIENIELFEFGTNDFTLECWVYPIEENEIGGGTCIARWGGSNNAFFFQADTTEGIATYLNNTFIDEASGGTILPNTWSHICLTRSNGQVRGFINGELIGTAQFSDSIETGETKLRIGGDVYGNTKFNGYIDEVRIINNFAAYTGNFTPSNQPFPNP